VTGDEASVELSRWRRVRDPLAATLTDRTFLMFVRWTAVGVWVIAFLNECYRYGVPFDREGVIFWIVTLLLAATIGKRAAWTVLVDWLPFAAVLVVYDYARGISDTLGMPTWWSPQLDVDKWLFGGVVPTVWLQEHFKHPVAQWWDVAVSLTYVSFFFLPYVTAGAFWLRSRRDFRRWAARFVTLSFLGFGLFALIPAAPPWAAARCTGSQVADHPSDPTCLGFHPGWVPGGGMLGKVSAGSDPTHAYIQRISGRGWPKLHLGIAQSLLDKGQGAVDVVAAVPSLHAGGTLLFVLFVWRRVRVGWKAVLVAYAIFMGVALVYSAEHYVSDILAGWLCAVLVSWAFDRLERRQRQRKPPDTLDGPTPQPTASRMENPCPPTATTPSST
jgi:membrane-associated phospholipid phosphatase